jgi:hypothetical protein
MGMRKILLRSLSGIAFCEKCDTYQGELKGLKAHFVTL